MEKKEYIISPITTYNEWENLFETKVGTNEKDMPLLYVVCGKTEAISRKRAESLVSFLSK